MLYAAGHTLICCSLVSDVCTKNSLEAVISGGHFMVQLMEVI